MWRLLTLLSLVPAISLAQIIPDRSTLDAVIGGNGALADFEGFEVADGGAYSVVGVQVLDNQSILDTQGPGLVPPGITFFGSAGDNLQWHGFNYYGAPSRSILFFSGQTIGFDFDLPATAFGLDLRAFTGYPDAATVTIYAPDRVTILDSFGDITLDTSGVPVFFGYQAASGIGRVTVTQFTNDWSPLIDNVAFTPVPEPSVLGLLMTGGAAYAAWRRCRIPRRKQDIRLPA